MKKILFSLLAVAALASCMKEQTLSVAEGSRIGFAGSFVENATRAAANPSTTTENIEEFFVWGVMDNETGVVFDDERVYKANAGWTYDETQYWTPNHTYYFSALAGDRSNDQIVLDLASAADNGMSVDGLGTLTFTNVEGVNDVLYSESTRTTGASITSQPADVKFQFNHLLSKVKFSFTNGFVNQNNAIIVKNIKMYVPKTGVIDLTKDAYEWTDHAGETVLDMGNINAGANVLAGASASSDNERLTIPAAATQEYTVTFDVELYMGAVLASSASKTVKIEGCLLEPGKGYNFKAILNEQNVDENPLFPITFDAEVDEWDEWYDYDGGVLADNTYVVYTRDELQAVLDAANKAGENVKAVFGADIEGNVTVYELPNLTNIIDGNNFKFNGTFVIDGKSTYGKGTTVFENINFETTDASSLSRDAFIWCGTYNSDTSMRYPDNVTVRNCTFNATGVVDAEGPCVAGIKQWSLSGKLVVENCSATGMHSLVQLASCGDADATFNNITIENSKNGLSFQNNKATVTNSTIKTTGYGIRANGTAATAVSIEGSTIEAKQPVIVRKMTVDGFVLNVDDASVFATTLTDPYVVIFTTKDDDEAYVAPTAKYTCNVPEAMKPMVFPTPEGYARTADDFAAQMKADKENISVILVEDLDVPITSLGTITGGSGEYKLGGESTKNITIDLNGKKLNIETTYWSALGAKNENALFTIKNGTMTSTGNSAGTWNAWDLRFSNCNYAFEDVDFEKAVALDNAGKSTSMKNVNITDSHNTDTYGLWITAEGQTVTLEDCVIDMTPASDGRGIKIDNQYVTDQKKVTLNVKNVTFKTEEKSAILVKSVAGAEINASGLDIAAVAADDEFAVWVDEDAKAYADKVVVNGALKKVEGTQGLVVAGQSALASAAIENNATVVLAAGDYVVPASAKGKNVTFVGTGNPEDVKVAVTKVGSGGENCDYGLDGSNAVFDGVTITTNSSLYIGYARCNGTYRNCVINGTYTLYGKSVFENCTFNVSGDVYNIWTWGAKEISFTNCTFNSDGKALLLYQEGTNVVTLNVTDCTFNDKGGLTAKKAAIEIGDAPYGAKPTYNLNVTNTLVNGYEINDEGISTGTTLWGNKNSMPQDRLNVSVNGVNVY